MPPSLEVEGDDPLCRKDEEWGLNGHVDPASEFLGPDTLTPDTCWDLANGQSVDLAMKWRSQHDDSGEVERVQWRMYPIPSYLCPLPSLSDPHDTIVDIEIPNQVWETTYASFEVPSAAECLRFGLWQAESGGGELNMWIWMFTKLSHPTNLSSPFDGDTVILTWSSAESAQAILDRSPGDTTWLGVGVERYADPNWDPGTTYTYRVRHRSKPLNFDARLSDWSDTSQVTIPDTLTVYIFGDTIVAPDDTCSYSAVAEGGTPQYDYLWSGDAEGSSQIIWQSFPLRAKPYSVIVTVTDSFEWESRDTLEVQVSGSAPDCHAR